MDTIRVVDNVGRIMIPVEVRRLLNIGPGTPLKVSVAGEDIVYSKLMGAGRLEKDLDDLLFHMRQVEEFRDSAKGRAIIAEIKKAQAIFKKGGE